MNEIQMLYFALIAMFLPLVGFVITLFTGKKLKYAYIFETTIITITFILSVILLLNKVTTFIDYRFGYALDVALVWAGNWITLPNPITGNPTIIELGIKFDNLAAIMLFVVSTVSMLVHYFSIAYMHNDPRFNRFFAYLGLFTFSMFGIVLTHNLLMMYMFWELVGLSSYLLIGFWFEKKSASDASKKAFIVNRIGDLGMFAGVMIIFLTYGTFTFDKVFAAINSGVLPFNSDFWLTVTGLLLFAGAIGKSAQFPLHVWLPDAMEGPTPVSALIHAATMVAAGVYLIARIFPMLTADALLAIAMIGALSSIIPATIAITQNDIKKVLAYSTISQLGYMVLALGVGAFNYAFFHLVTHAFFKAGLFLGSGSVIHGMHHEQDIREMGGLRKKMPITYYTFLFFTLAISGVPLTSGFLSKDGVLAGTLAFGMLTGHYLFTVIGFFVAFLTATYMFRLVILTFHGKPRNLHKYDHAHESPYLMTIPLIVLALLTTFIFYTANPIAGHSGWFLKDWVNTPQTVAPESSRFDFMISEAKTYDQQIEAGKHHVIHSEEYTHTMHTAEAISMVLSLAIGGIGILLAFSIFQWKKISLDPLPKWMVPIHRFSYNKWYFDELYDVIAVQPTLLLARFLAWFDRTIVDGVVNGVATITRAFSMVIGWIDTNIVDGLVNFSAKLADWFGYLFRKTQTGSVQTYIVYAIVSLIIAFVLLVTI